MPSLADLKISVISEEFREEIELFKHFQSQEKIFLQNAQ